MTVKHARGIQEHHWEGTTKYLQIRSTHTRQQVVKQMWLAYPGEEVGISPKDSAVVWTPNGPDCPRGEVLEGMLGLVPLDRVPGETIEEAG